MFFREAEIAELRERLNREKNELAQKLENEKEEMRERMEKENQVIYEVQQCKVFLVSLEELEVSLKL